jgi:DNA-directed RNA polymerase specialized sigma24 family protein
MDLEETMMTNPSQRNLFKSYFMPLIDTAYGVALYLTGERRAAEELVEQSAIRAFAAFCNDRPSGSFKVWFLALLMREFMERPPRPAAPVGSTVRSSVSEEARMAGVFGRLPIEQRMVCALYFMDDFSYAEMAKMTGDTIDRTRQQLHEGRARLQSLLRNGASPMSLSPQSHAAALSPA